MYWQCQAPQPPQSIRLPSSISLPIASASSSSSSLSSAAVAPVHSTAQRLTPRKTWGGAFLGSPHVSTVALSSLGSGTHSLPSTGPVLPARTLWAWPPLGLQDEDYLLKPMDAVIRLEVFTAAASSTHISGPHGSPHSASAVPADMHRSQPDASPPHGDPGSGPHTDTFRVGQATPQPHYHCEVQVGVERWEMQASGGQLKGIADLADELDVWDCRNKYGRFRPSGWRTASQPGSTNLRVRIATAASTECCGQKRMDHLHHSHQTGSFRGSGSANNSPTHAWDTSATSPSRTVFTTAELAGVKAADQANDQGLHTISATPTDIGGKTPRRSYAAAVTSPSVVTQDAVLENLGGPASVPPESAAAAHFMQTPERTAHRSMLSSSAGTSPDHGVLGSHSSTPSQPVLRTSKSLSGTSACKTAYSSPDSAPAGSRAVTWQQVWQYAGHAVMHDLWMARARKGEAIPLRRYVHYKRQYTELYCRKLDLVRNNIGRETAQQLSQVRRAGAEFGREFGSTWLTWKCDVLLTQLVVWMVKFDNSNDGCLKLYAG